MKPQMLKLQMVRIMKLQKKCDKVAAKCVMLVLTGSCYDKAGDVEPGDGEPGDGEAGDGEAGDGEAGDGEAADMMRLEM